MNRQSTHKASTSVPSKVMNKGTQDQFDVATKDPETEENVASKPGSPTLLEPAAVSPIGQAQKVTEPVEQEKPLLPNNVLASLLTDSTNIISGSKRTAFTRVMNSKLGVVNHKNSKRCVLHQEVRQKLGLEVGDIVQCTVKDEMVLLLKSRNDKGILLKNSGNLYCKELVVSITDMFNFDFSIQSTHHLTNVTYQDWNGQLVAILTP